MSELLGLRQGLLLLSPDMHVLSRARFFFLTTLCISSERSECDDSIFSQPHEVMLSHAEHASSQHCPACGGLAWVQSIMPAGRLQLSSPQIVGGAGYKIVTPSCPATAACSSAAQHWKKTHVTLSTPVTGQLIVGSDFLPTSCALRPILKHYFHEHSLILSRGSQRCWRRKSKPAMQLMR